MENKNNNKVLIIVIAVLILIIIGGVIFVVHSNKDNNQKNDAAKSKNENIVSRPELHEEAGVILSDEDANSIKQAEPATFVSDYKRTITVTNKKMASCYMGNSSSNYYNKMYFQLFLTDKDGNFSENDEIYLSGTIPKGSHIENFELNKELEAGEYKGVVTFVMLTDEDEIASAFNFEVDIISK